MHIKTIVSAAVLAAALGFSGATFAQTMIGNQNISEADMERVKVYCEDLKTADNQSSVTTDSDGETNDSSQTSGTAAVSVGSVDMDAITLENCIDAGIVERVGG